MREKIITIIKQTLKLKDDTILRDDITPGSLPEWDSMGHMLLITELEKQLQVKFEYDDILAMDSVGAIIKVVTDKYSR